MRSRVELITMPIIESHSYKREHNNLSVTLAVASMILRKLRERKKGLLKKDREVNLNVGSGWLLCTGEKGEGEEKV